MKRLSILLAATSAMVATNAWAVQVYNAPADLTGNQGWTGTLGLNFKVNSTVNVSQIGVFGGGFNPLASSLLVTIFDSSHNELFTPVQFAAGTPSTGGAYIFAPINYTLTPGTYQLASWGFNGSNQNYNRYSGDTSPVTFNSVNGALTALDTTYSNADAPGVYASNQDVGVTRYGSASFVAAAVPEPATWAMLLLGFGMIGFAMRKRSNVRTTVSYA